MRLFVEVNLVCSVLAFVLTAIGVAKNASTVAAVQLIILAAWITWGVVLVTR